MSEQDVLKLEAELDRLRDAIRQHRHEMSRYKAAFYDIALWSVLNDGVDHGEAH